MTRAPARRLPLTVAVGWLAMSAILIVIALPMIVGFEVRDPDDWMRLLEVRDLLAGQSWWDVAQHRLNGGEFPMHWSRLVDLPLAAMMLPLEPVLGAPVAERVAMTAVPLVTLLAIVGGAAALTRQVADRMPAQLAVGLGPLSIPILMQAQPMRIDHHGWQIALAVWATVAVTRRPTVRAGAAAGLALATLVTISLEGLPITAAITGVAALAWSATPGERARFTRALALTLVGATLALHVATRGPHALEPACDAISPAYLAAVGLGSLGLALATLFGSAPWPARAAALAAAGGAAGAVFVWLAPGCLKGPFATLDPLVYRYWYLNVLEGRPAWEQGPWGLIILALPVVGLAGGARAWRDASGEWRTGWTLLLGIQGAAFVLAVLVARAGGTANALAIPGAAVLIARLLPRARAIGRPLPRIVATAGTALLASPGLIVGLMLLVAPAEPLGADTGAASRRVPVCHRLEQARALSALPPGTVFAPIDLTPEILVNTPHRGVAAGYHRGAAAMHKVIAAFLADPARAEPIVAATGARYLVACAGSQETDIYRTAAPHGLWARLERGERFAWLTPVPVPGSPVLAWRVRPLPGAARPL